MAVKFFTETGLLALCSNPHPGGVPILVAFYDMHGLQWDYSFLRSPHGEWNGTSSMNSLCTRVTLVLCASKPEDCFVISSFSNCLRHSFYSLNVSSTIPSRLVYRYQDWIITSIGCDYIYIYIYIYLEWGSSFISSAPEPSHDYILSPFHHLIFHSTQKSPKITGFPIMRRCVVWPTVINDVIRKLKRFTWLIRPKWIMKLTIWELFLKLTWCITAGSKNTTASFWMTLLLSYYEICCCFQSRSETSKMDHPGISICI
jgi:hypothetical protein